MSQLGQDLSASSHAQKFGSLRVSLLPDNPAASLSNEDGIHFVYPRLGIFNSRSLTVRKLSPRLYKTRFIRAEALQPALSDQELAGLNLLVHEGIAGYLPPGSHSAAAISLLDIRTGAFISVDLAAEGFATLRNNSV